MCIIIYTILGARDLLKSLRFGFFTLEMNIGIFYSRDPCDSEVALGWDFLGFPIPIPGIGVGHFSFRARSKNPRNWGFLKIWEFLFLPNPRDWEFLEDGDFSGTEIFFPRDWISHQKATFAWDLVTMILRVFSLGFPNKKPSQKYLILRYSEFLDIKTMIHFSVGTLVSFVFLGRIWRVVWGLESSHGDWVPCWRRRHWNWISQLGTRDSLLFWILTLEISSKFKW